MRRYFFHVFDGEHHHDREGTEFETLKQVRDAATIFCASMMADRSLRGQPARRWELNVTDHSGATVLQLKIEE